MGRKNCCPDRFLRSPKMSLGEKTGVRTFGRHPFGRQQFGRHPFGRQPIFESICLKN